MHRRQACIHDAIEAYLAHSWAPALHDKVRDDVYAMLSEGTSADTAWARNCRAFIRRHMSTNPLNLEI